MPSTNVPRRYDHAAVCHKLTYFLYQAVKKGGYTANLGTTLFFATFKAFCQKDVDAGTIVRK